ncbi:MAG: hypothetical protein RID09_20260 [Coleofasciculus sp. G1-WW12-02]|uniref:hypothetical protein n=1 Tax=Coleofasciculus sp. G1-WW12-02 TaxID=3068483 RepID=UPI0032F5A197
MRSALLVPEAIAPTVHPQHPDCAIAFDAEFRSIALNDSLTSYDQSKIQPADYANPD